MWHGRSCTNARYTPQWASQRLLLGCFFILLFGAIELFHAPHFAIFQQADENLKSHSTQYSVAQHPAKLRIRNDSPKRQTDEDLLKAFERLKAFELPSGDLFLPSVPLTLGPVFAYKHDLNRVAPHYACSCRAVLPPNRAPPSLKAS